MKISQLKKFMAAVAVITFASPVFFSCIKNSDEVDYIPVQIREDGSWTFIDAQGNRVGTQEWEFEPSVTKGGIFVAKSDSGLTVYRWKGNEAKPLDSLQNLVSVGILNEGLLPVTPRMKRIRVVNAAGKMKFELTPIDGKEISSCNLQFKEGMLIVRTTEGKCGVIDSKGKVVVTPKYSDISDFHDGFALAVDFDYEDENNELKYYVLNTKGDAIPVKGKLGYWGSEEGDCGTDLPVFENGYVYVNHPYVEDPEKQKMEEGSIRISTDGSTQNMKESINNEYLENGSVISYDFTDNGTESVWKDKEGKLIKKFDDYVYAQGIYVVQTADKEVTVYKEDGQVLLKKDGASYASWPGGKFGPVIYDYDVDTSKSSYYLYDMEGKPLATPKVYGVGTSLTIPAYESSDEVDCGVMQVTSAYVDITAAAAKIASMATGSVFGKKSYYLGESAKDILEGDKASYYTYSGKTFSIPTDDTGHLADGEGFWVNGTAHTSADVVAPTYQNYFEVHHYDYWGNAWGWNRKRQVGVHFNSAAKVTVFDIQLHTNHPSGSQLREAITRRMKKEGFTQIASEPNYDEYDNGSSRVIIYGNSESNGVGAYIGNDNVAKMKESDKAALAASLY